MGFIEKLNKYGVKTSYTKTSLYKDIEKKKVELEKLGLQVKIKNVFDMLQYEIIYKGFMTQQKIENAYDIFVLQNQEILKYMNYKEKQKMFNADIYMILENASHFYDAESQTDIFIPYLLPSYNHQYTQDYQTLTLKQYRTYLDNIQITNHTPQDIYGSSVYDTQFSSLEKIYENENQLYLYYDELKTIYIFHKDTHECLNKIIVQDSKSHPDINKEELKSMILFIENQDYKECLDFLKEKNMICEKNYKKLLKKCK